MRVLTMYELGSSAPQRISKSWSEEIGMPTYEYQCTKCQGKFDIFHSMNSIESRHCPTCGGLGKKLLSASSIIFKGSGFYTTDYRDSGYVEAKKKDSTSPSSATPATTAKPEGASSGSESASPAPATPAPTQTATPAASAPSTSGTKVGTPVPAT